MRVVAGPKGSGETTILQELRPEWVGIFVNADDIERELRDSNGTLDLGRLGVTGSPSIVLRCLRRRIKASEFAKTLGFHGLLGRMRIDASRRLHVPGPHDS